ncbi:MAG: hypothetical protein FWB80_04300 [Defluviitaleaceae bacterium]|nr:hypothetical protein [Defluviitaleaceae bacterium]
MEYTMEAVAGKMITVIVVLSAIIAGISYFLFMSISADTMMMATILGVNTGATAADAIPFIVGILLAMGVNIAKVILMKRAVTNAIKREEGAASMYLKGQYFMRLIITAVVLLIAGYLHSNALTVENNPLYVNFMGAFFGIFTFPVATHSMRFFLRDALKDDDGILNAPKSSANDIVQDAIDKLNAIGAEEDPIESTDSADVGDSTGCD